MLKITGKKTYQISRKEGAIRVNGEPAPFEILHQKGDEWVVRANNKIQLARVLKREEKYREIEIGSRIYVLTIEDENDLLMAGMGLQNKSQNKAGVLKAPMPGLILKVQVRVGQEVKKGDVLLVLEAMKMENVIKADHDGKITEIPVNEREKVEKNQILLRF